MNPPQTLEWTGEQTLVRAPAPLPAPRRRRFERPAQVALALVPGALVLYTGFSGGGYFAGTPAVAAAALAVLLALRVALAERPFAGLSRRHAPAAAGLALFALWILVSAAWSDAPGRALVEFDRALLYLLVVVLVGSLPRHRRTMRSVLYGLAGAAVAICAAGLASRLLPGVVHTAPAVVPQRLGWPLTYWNALGLLAALGSVLCLYLACDERGSRLTRVLGAAALPILLPTLLFTFSRGAIAALTVGVITLLVLGRQRGAPSGVLAALPAGFATGETWRFDQLHGGIPKTAAAIDKGHELALIVAVCVIAAAALRFLLLPLDERLREVRVPHRPLLAAALAAAAVAVPVVLGPLHGAQALRGQVDRFSAGPEQEERSDVRSRLSDPANNGRIRHWRVALRAHADEPLRGYGAGTFQLEWAKRRSSAYTVVDGHSLYLETLAELGWVGFALLMTALVALIAGAASRCRGPDRALFAAATAVLLAWALEAGVDWMWEVPAVTIVPLALGGAALAGRSPGRARWSARALVGIGLMLLAVTPARMALSQGQLNSAVSSFKRHDCRIAVDHGLAANSALSSRAEPFEVLGYCDVRLQRPRLGVRMLEAAVRRDPHNWEVHYGLALARGAARQDPRAEARRALELNPREPLARRALARFRRGGPASWQRQALRSRISMP